MAINVSHPIGQYLRWALLPVDSLKEQASNVAAGGSVGSTTSLPQGTAYVPASSYTTWATPVSTIDTYNNSITIAWYGKIDTTGQSVLAQYVGGYGWYLQSEAWSDNVISLRFGTWWGGGSSLRQLGVTNGTVHHIALRYRKSAGKIDIFLDGTAVATDVAWTPDPGAAGAGGTFYMRNTIGSCACITAQVYQGELSDSDIASLAVSPLQVFVSPPVTLTVSSATQGNNSLGGIVGIGGIFYASNVTQANASSSAQITRAQSLTIDSVIQNNASASVSINPYSRLRGILASQAPNTWVQVNTTRYVDCQMPVSDRPVAFPSDADHVKIVNPWSGFAFDRTFGRLLLWGGGHANYSGNQLYACNMDTGAWEQMCLPSAVDGNAATRYIVDKKGPQSSHTYQNNLWLEVNQMFCTFAGAAYVSGGPPLEDDSGTPRRVAPWVYDLTKKDSSKVGGGDGSGVNPARLGLNAWRHRRDNVPIGASGTNTYPIVALGHVSGKSVATVIGGKDVVFTTMDAGSGFPYYYKYQFGDIRAGENDTCTYMGRSGTIIVTEGWMVYDPSRGFCYGNAYAKDTNYTQCELIAKNMSAPGIAPNPIRLVKSVDGTAFDMNPTPGLPYECPYGAVYDTRNDCIWLWGGTSPDTGVVYRINIPAFTAGTWSSTTWTVDQITPAGLRPYGLYQTPILGKIKYVPEAGAFIILDSASTDGLRDPGVWMFKTTDLGPDQPVNGLVCAPSVQDNIAAASSIVQAHVLAAANTTQSNLGATGVISLSTGNLIGEPSAQINLGDTGYICQIGVVPDGWLASQTVSSVLKKPGIPAGTPDWLKTMIEILTGRRCNKIAVPPLQNLTFSATATKAECEALYSYVNDIRASLDSLVNRLDG
ncbi:MAG TPA: hypothetical protein VF780_09165 [Nitrosospira sp.]